MPTRPLPNDPSLEHLRKQAKRLRNAVRTGEPEAVAQVTELHPRPGVVDSEFSLSDAQLVTARLYGFPSWAKLKQHLHDIAPFVWNPAAPNPESQLEVFLHLACLTYLDWHRSNPERAVRMLGEHPALGTASIHAAAAVGDAEALGRMLDADPALLNASGGPLQWPPLLYSCYSRIPASDGRSTVECVRLLLSRGADPNAGFLFSATYAFTALTGAFGRGEDWPNQPPHPESEAVARSLLAAGADPNDAQALYNRHFHADDSHLKILFEYGLGKDRGGRWLRLQGDESANPAVMLVQQLAWAVMKGFSARVRLLVEHGVDVNMRSLRSGRTAYEEALRSGHHAIADYLLQHGARKVELDAVETFALTCIAGRKDEARARLAADPTLLERLGHHGRTELLHRAVEARNIDGIRLIVELGVDINGMVPGTGYDRAVLHNAAAWGGLAMVKLLLELGADPQLRDLAFNGAPIGWALYGRQRDVVSHLLPLASLFDAVRADGLDRVAALLDQDPALVHSGDGGTPLSFALHPELPHLGEMLTLLLGRGMDLNARDKDGATFLDHVVIGGATEFGAYVRERGARTSAELEKPD